MISSLFHRWRTPRGFCALLLSASALLPFASPPRAYAVSEPSALTGQKQSYAYSWQEEVKDGAEADKEITQQMGLYDDPQVQSYVQSVGQRVLAASTFADPSTPPMYRGTQFTFRVLDTPVVNAFALPGGYVYVTRGLLAHVDDEAQLAVVLGHEIGHVAARHASQQARRSQWSQLGLAVGAILGQAVLGDRMPNLAANVLNTGGEAMQVFMLRYSREAENEADTLGVNYALRAGYAAGDSARFFSALQRLAAQEGSGLPTWMSTHPDPGNRAEHVRALAAAAPGAGSRVLGRDEFLPHLNGLIVGDDPRQGFTRRGVFYHPTLGFQLPVAPGWKVDNEAGAVVFADPNGRATMSLKLAPARRTHDAAAQFVSQNNVQVAASGDTAINGLPATVVLGQTAGQQGAVGVWDAFVELGGKVYSLLGYGPAGTFEQVRPTFESVAAGFSALRDPRWANVAPARLRVVRADRQAPFASFVPTSLPPDLNAEALAIMNQVSLNETVPRGAELKVIDTPAPQFANPGAAPTGSYADPSAYPTPANVPAPSAPIYAPANNYPSNGQTYPPAQAYPPQASPPPPSSAPTYPTDYPTATPTYPPAPAPQSAPVYPDASGYPPATGYPPSGGDAPTYPPATAPSYPPNTTSYPQFPQPPAAGTTPPPPAVPWRR
jgi:predicted Zn-dependent protease